MPIKDTGAIQVPPPSRGGIKWDPSLPYPRGPDTEGPTCEYLNFMPIKGTDTGALKVLEGTSLPRGPLR